MALTAKQQEAIPLLKNYKDVMLYGGSRSGKTYLVIYVMLYRGVIAECRQLVLRRYAKQVRQAIWLDTLMKVIRNEFPDNFIKVCQFNNQEMVLSFPNKEGSTSEIWFGGLDNSNASEKILGTEYSTIFINEASEFNNETIEKVISRNAEKSSIRNLLIMDMNPVSKSHWTHKKYVEKIDPESRRPLKFPNCHFLMNPQDNIENLDPDYLARLEDLSEDSRNRFLKGEFSDETEDAIWRSSWIYHNRAKSKTWDDLQKETQIVKTVVAVDPAVSKTDRSDLTGIVVVAKDYGGHYYVIDDKSFRGSPKEWANRVCSLYEKYQADYVVIEINQGGDMCEQTLRNSGYTGKINNVRASKGKHARADPIAALYERGTVHHLDTLDLLPLEEQLLDYVPDLVKSSPDRLDALVWAITEMQEGDKRLDNLRGLAQHYYG